MSSFLNFFLGNHSQATTPVDDVKMSYLDADDSGRSGRIRLPGFGLPVKCQPEIHFPSAVIDWTAASYGLVTIRELCMVSFIETITNKPEWHVKVFNEEIVAKWKEELFRVDWQAAGIPNGDFTDAMFALCVTELRAKAEVFEKTGLTAVLDTDACVVRSDTAVPPQLKESLKQAIAPLEDVSDHKKDWHPGSNGQVLDLVHPSLFPLIYGRSRVLPDRRFDLEECLPLTGLGEVVPVPGKAETEEQDAPNLGWGMPEALELVWSRAFQWLPCDVEISKDDNTAKIVSYINSLHPAKHSALYSVVEQMITKALPLWHTAWRYLLLNNVPRIKCTEAVRRCNAPQICQGSECSAHSWPGLPEGETTEDEEEAAYIWFNGSHPAIKPEPSEPTPSRKTSFAVSPDDLAAEGGLLDAAGNRLQVIVKLANIHLTPEKPDYPGGSWHVEGQLNEHICATLLYYYDCENITTSLLSFRTRIECPGDPKAGYESSLGYQHFDHGPITEIFGIDNDGPRVQGRGDVLTREDRLLAFPNVWQHRVKPFRLADPTRPGYRKILALFLVDPAVRVLSTANVPPQQKEWWGEQLGQSMGLLDKLPPEMLQAVIDAVPDFPISLEEAKEIRAELIKERSALSDRIDDRMELHTWNFCEH